MHRAISLGHVLRILVSVSLCAGGECVESLQGAEGTIFCAGRVRSVSGEPIGAVDVWVVEVMPADYPLVMAKTRSDKRGEFNTTVTLPPEHRALAIENSKIASLDGPDWDSPPIRSRKGWLPGYDFGIFADPPRRCLQIWVRSTTRVLGWSAPLPVNSFVRTTIVLQPVADRLGVVQAADETAVRAPKVGLVGLPSRDGSGRFNSGSHYCLMPRDWTESFAINAAADGHFEAKAWPTGDILVVGSGEGLAELMTPWTTPQAAVRDGQQLWKLRLVPAEPLRGQVRRMHLEDLPDQLSLLHREAVYLSDGKGNVKGAGIHLATTTALGRDFVFENAPKRDSRRDANAISLIRPDHSQELQGTQLRTHFTTVREANEQPVLFVYRVAPVQGRLIDEKTGLPVPGAEVNFEFAESPQNAPRLTHAAITDGAGRFHRTITIANYWVKTSYGSSSAIPPRSKFPSMLQLILPPFLQQIDWKELQPGRPLDIPDIKVRCQNYVAVTVVDSQGQAVPDAELLVEIMKGSLEPISLSNREGRFVIPLTDIFSGICLSARHGELVSEPTHIVHVPGHVPKNELTLELKPESTTRIVGTIVNAQGQPLAGRPVIVWREVYSESDPREHTTRGIVVETLLTGQDGRFRSSAQWVGEAYYVQVRGLHGETVNTHRLVAAAGSTIDVGRMIVPHRRVTATGRIADSTGTPVADAIVGTLGLRSCLTRTGPDGKFQLDDLADFGEVIYVEHSRYRPVARIVREPYRDLEIQVVGRDEVNLKSPVAVERFENLQPLWPVLSTSTARDRESLDRARRVVALLRTLPDNASFALQQLVPILSRIAPLEAIDLYSKSSAIRGFTSPIFEAFLRLAEDDPECALQALQRLDTLDMTDMAGRLADWYSSRDPIKAALFASRYLALYTPRQDEFDSPLQMAWAGHWKIDRGEREAGLDALSRAAQILEDGPKKHRSYLRADVLTVDRLLRQHSPALAAKITGASPNFGSRKPNEMDWSELRPETARGWLERLESRRLAPADFGRPSDVSILQQVAAYDEPTARRLAGFLGRMRHQHEYRWTLATIALWDQTAAWDLIDEDVLDLRRLDAEFWHARRPPQSRFEQAARLLVAGESPAKKCGINRT